MPTVTKYNMSGAKVGEIQLMMQYLQLKLTKLLCIKP